MDDEFDLYADQDFPLPPTELSHSHSHSDTQNDSDQPTPLKTEKTTSDSPPPPPPTATTHEPLVGETEDQRGETSKASQQAEAIQQAIAIAQSDTEATTCLHVSELDWWTSDEDLRQIAASVDAAGGLMETTFFEHKVNGKSRGVAYMEFSSKEACARTKHRLDKMEIDGRRPQTSYMNPASGNPFKTVPKDPPPKAAGRGRGRGGVTSSTSEHVVAPVLPTRPPTISSDATRGMVGGGGPGVVGMVGIPPMGNAGMAGATGFPPSIQGGMGAFAGMPFGNAGGFGFPQGMPPHLHQARQDRWGGPAFPAMRGRGVGGMRGGGRGGMMMGRGGGGMAFGDEFMLGGGVGGPIGPGGFPVPHFNPAFFPGEQQQQFGIPDGGRTEAPPSKRGRMDDDNTNMQNRGW